MLYVKVVRSLFSVWVLSCLIYDTEKETSSGKKGVGGGARVYDKSCVNCVKKKCCFSDKDKVRISYLTNDNWQGHGNF